jgi:hypothetical protein
MKYPFMFIKQDREEVNGPLNGKECVIVKIASYDLATYQSEWMDDPALGKHCWVPDVDLTHERYEFDSEIEALRFIQSWWAKQELA